MSACGSAAINASQPRAAPTSATTPATSSRPVASRSRSEEHTSELQSLMRISYAVFCLKKTKTKHTITTHTPTTYTTNAQTHAINVITAETDTSTSIDAI